MCKRITSMGGAAILAGFLVSVLGGAASPAQTISPDNAGTRAASTALEAVDRPAQADEPLNPNLDAPSRVRVDRVSAKKMQLRWSGVTDASKYVVFKKASGAKTFKRTAVVSGSVRMWFDRKVKPSTTVSYRVQACTVDGCGKLSRAVKAKAYKKGSTTRNVGRVKTEWHPIDYSIWESHDLEAQALPSSKSNRKVAKAKKWKPLSMKLRYVSTNPRVATVTKRGVIEAQNVGTATIRVIAHNGIEKRIKVKVHNYAKNVKYQKQGYWIDDYWAAVGPQTAELVSYILEHRLEGKMWLDDAGEVASSGIHPKLPLKRPLPEVVVSLGKEIMYYGALPVTIEFSSYGVVINREGDTYRLWVEYDVNYWAFNGDYSFAPRWSVGFDEFVIEEGW